MRASPHLFRAMTSRIPARRWDSAAGGRPVAGDARTGQPAIGEVAGAGARRSTGAGAWWRLFQPRRTIRPTRDGWWVLFAAVGLGVAAINTGNNLLYLLCSTLLGLVIVSGILSEQTMRGLKVESVRPDEIFAGRPAVLGAWVRNGKRWLASYSVVVEAGTAAGASSFHVPRLAPGG